MDQAVKKPLCIKKNTHHNLWSLDLSFVLRGRDKVEFVFSNLFYIFQSQIWDYVLWSLYNFFSWCFWAKLSILNGIIAFVKPIRRPKRMLSELVLLSFFRGKFLTFSIELIELFYVLVYFYVAEVCARNYYIY